jgi:hypothetical protein
LGTKIGGGEVALVLQAASEYGRRKMTGKVFISLYKAAQDRKVRERLEQ